MWLRNTPAQQAESLMQAHELRANSRRMRDSLGAYEGQPGQVREVTGQDPLEEEDE